MSVERFGQLSLYVLGLIAVYGAIDIAFIGGNSLAGYTASSRSTDLVLALLSLGVSCLAVFLARLNDSDQKDEARSELRMYIG